MSFTDLNPETLQDLMLMSCVQECISSLLDGIPEVLPQFASVTPQLELSYFVSNFCGLRHVELCVCMIGFY